MKPTRSLPASDVQSYPWADEPARLVLLLFIVGVFAPFLRVAPGIGSDTQPIALLAGALLLSGSNLGRQPAPIALFFIVAVTSAGLLLVDGVSMVALRNWSNYVSLFVIAACCWLAAARHRRLLASALWGAIWTWFVVGASQVLISPQLGTALLAAARRSEERGVVGLAPEPTTYALICITFMITALVLLQGRRRTIATAVCLIQIVLFAKSAMGVLLLLLWGALVLIGNLISGRRLAVSLAAAVLLLLGGALLIGGRIPGLEESRLRSLAYMAVSDPRYVFMVDQSGAARLASIVYAIAGFVDKMGLPHGFTAWLSFPASVSHRFTLIPDVPGGSRPMSGYGAAMFELGFSSVLLFIAFTWAFLRHYGAHWKLHWPTIAFFHIMLFTALPLATPTIAMIAGVLAAGPAPAEPAPPHTNSPSTA